MKRIVISSIDPTSIPLSVPTILGRHNHVKDSKFDAQQLAMGIEVESEHTDIPEQAKAIAKDHLSEDPFYYTHLKEMEDKYRS